MNRIIIGLHNRGKSKNRNAYSGLRETSNSAGGTTNTATNVQDAHALLQLQLEGDVEFEASFNW